MTRPSMLRQAPPCPRSPRAPDLTLPRYAPLVEVFELARRHVKSAWQDFAINVASTQQSEVHSWLSARAVRPGESRDITVENYQYRGAFEISRSIIDRGEMTAADAGQLTAWGEMAGHWEEDTLAEVIGDNPSGFDGELLFDANSHGNEHRSVDGAMRAMRERAGESGAPLGLRPALILASPERANDAGHAAHRLNLRTLILDMLTDEWLYLVAEPVAGMMPLIMQVRRPPHLVGAAFSEQGIVLSVDARGGAATALWQTIDRFAHRP
jgi:hypothetical protein